MWIAKKNGAFMRYCSGSVLVVTAPFQRRIRPLRSRLVARQCAFSFYVRQRQEIVPVVIAITDHMQDAFEALCEFGTMEPENIQAFLLATRPSAEQIEGNIFSHTQFGRFSVNDGVKAVDALIAGTPRPPVQFDSGGGVSILRHVSLMPFLLWAGGVAGGAQFICT
jgi:hypothetical protein